MYQVIARKYRPQTFDEVVGQEHVKQTLRNAIDQRRIAHGYIFSGPRGTGKTTTARILAMALNCEDGPKSTPDPKSPVCSEIAAGASLDVVEIDAASNRRIDDIRELRESVRFRPVRDRYKVFIIDEAHQITGDAFNALLKTLEEPPEWTVFVLCTTEPQAIPATIVSRCQSFAFRAVAQAAVLEHLRRICRSEGVEAEEDALVAMALAGDGSIRDSLSTLDQAIAAFGNRLETAGVRDLLGSIPAELTERILASIRDSDAAAMLAIADEALLQGRHPQHFCGELTRQFRNLLVMKVAGSDSKLVAAGEGEREAAERWLGEFSNEDLTRYVQILLALYQDLQQAMQQRFRLEVGLLKLVYAGRLRPIEQVLSGLPSGPVRRADRSAPPPAPEPSRPSSPRPKRDAPSPPPTPQPSAPTAAPATSAAPAAAPSPAAEVPAPARETKPPARGDSPGAKAPSTAAGAAETPPKDDLKQRLLAEVKEVDDYLFGALEACRLERDGRAVTVYVEPQWLPMVELQSALLEAALMGLVGGKPNVRLVGGSGGPTPKVQAEKTGSRASGGSKAEDVSERAQSDPAFLEFKKRMGGRVTKVMDLKGRTQ